MTYNAFSGMLKSNSITLSWSQTCPRLVADLLACCYWARW